MGRMPVCAYQTRLCRRRSMRERPRMQGEESTQHALHGNKATHHRPFWQSECMKHARPFGSTAVLALTLRIDRREAPANTPTCLDDGNWHITAAPRVAAPRAHTTRMTKPNVALRTQLNAFTRVLQALLPYIGVQALAAFRGYFTQLAFRKLCFHRGFTDMLALLAPFVFRPLVFSQGVL